MKWVKPLLLLAVAGLLWGFSEQVSEFINVAPGIDAGKINDFLDLGAKIAAIVIAVWVWAKKPWQTGSAPSHLDEPQTAPRPACTAWGSLTY